VFHDYQFSTGQKIALPEPAAILLPEAGAPAAADHS
jgi:hypothetical protein